MWADEVAGHCVRQGANFFHSFPLDNIISSPIKLRGSFDGSKKKNRAAGGACLEVLTTRGWSRWKEAGGFIPKGTVAQAELAGARTLVLMLGCLVKCSTIDEMNSVESLETQ